MHETNQHQVLSHEEFQTWGAHENLNENLHHQGLITGVDHNHQTDEEIHIDPSILALPTRKRNSWTEAKNNLLVEIVRNCRYPTPWRPKHGSNKEIWTEIAQRMNERRDVFEATIQWESAKEQLLKIIDKQALRRKSGDLTVKSNTEAYVDEMIRHMAAEDEEKAKAHRRTQERLLRRQKREFQSHELDIPGLSNSHNSSQLNTSLSQHPLPSHAHQVHHVAQSHDTGEKRHKPDNEYDPYASHILISSHSHGHHTHVQLPHGHDATSAVNSPRDTDGLTIHTKQPVALYQEAAACIEGIASSQSQSEITQQNILQRIDALEAKIDQNSDVLSNCLNLLSKIATKLGVVAREMHE